ncbi:hypothetical protein [Streptomyces sp. NPDC046161]|uniref:hypothetical protein n=1 Tax=Streptomyces sp. NPDC046161 TaxID=3155132 RepID=UPI00340D1B3A
MSFQQFLPRAVARIAGCATALGLALSVAAPTPAVADPTPAPRLTGVKVVKNTDTVSDFQQVSVACPTGSVAISGGAETASPGDVNDRIGLVGSFPEVEVNQPSARGWIANARDWAGEPITVTVWAVCALAPRGYEVVTAPHADVPSNQPSTISCPGGKTILGGGGEIQGEYTTLTKSHPSAFTSSGPTQWTVEGRNNQWSNVGVAGYAMCADPIADNQWTTYKVSKNQPSGGYLTCLNGRRVTSGGAAANAQESALRASRPGLTGEGADRDGWWVQAGSFYEPIDVDLYVMCSTR